MSLADKIDQLLAHIQAHEDYLEHNRTLLDIFNGNLSEYILRDLESSLSETYFNQMKERIIPINILRRLMDKLSKVYIGKPSRTTVNDSESDQGLVDYYVKQFEMNKKGNYADEYSNMFKGYAWEPFLHNEKPKLRTLAYDKFLPYSDDAVDPTEETVFIKFIGKRTVEVEDQRHTGGYREEDREVYFAFSDEEFIAFDSQGDIYEPAMQEVEDFMNVYETIPFIYGNRGRDQLIPTQDTDILRMTKVIPIILSDVSGAILFQCFSIIWGTDLDMENLTISPNAIWNMKSDSNSEHKPQIGTLKPEADIDKVAKFVFDVFVFWLETKGIRVGSLGDVNSANLASGISKVIDEMDVSEIRNVQAEEFQRDEYEFWDLMKTIHNYWVDAGLVKGKKKFTEDFEIKVEFDEPALVVDRAAQFAEIKQEVDAGWLTIEEAFRIHYPELDEGQIQERVKHYNDWNSVVVEDEDESPDGDDPEPKNEDEDENTNA